MLFGATDGGLEIRRKGDSTRISGSFPYNSTATLSDGGKRGRPQKERFASGAFDFSIDESDLDIHFLVGHDFGKPLASRNAGSLVLRSTDDALVFEATLSDAVMGTTHAKDALAMLSAGLVGGISPGFRIPPEQTVPDAETVTEEDPSEGRALIRTINQAVLYELSLVTRPAYSETEVNKRSWDLLEQPVQSTVRASRYRWR